MTKHQQANLQIRAKAKIQPSPKPQQQHLTKTPQLNNLLKLTKAQQAKILRLAKVQQISSQKVHQKKEKVQLLLEKAAQNLQVIQNLK